MDISKKLIVQTKHYNILEAEFNGLTQQVRIWNNGFTEMKFSDDFAKANGYVGIQDLIDKMKGMREYLDQVFGYVPQWITIDKDSGFIGFLELDMN